MCPNSSTGEHNYQLKTIPYPGGPIVVKVCILCGSEG